MEGITMNIEKKWIQAGSFLVALLTVPGMSCANESAHAKEMVRQACVTCHRIEGQPEPHPNLKGPDLSWSDGRFRLEAACWQSRKKTAQAPDEFLNSKNPLPETQKTIQAGELLFQQKAQPVSCSVCHGEKGDGNSKMSKGSVPPPRDFTCQSMMKDIPDGQLFWIIRNGSHGTPMISLFNLSDTGIWQIIHYIRSLAR